MALNNVVAVDHGRVIGGGSGDEHITTDAGTFEDAEHNTYTGITTDMISYDATNNQLLLKVGGADSVIPFSRKGGEVCIFYRMYGSDGYTSYTTIIVQEDNTLAIALPTATSEYYSVTNYKTITANKPGTYQIIKYNVLNSSIESTSTVTVAAGGTVLDENMSSASTKGRMYIITKI